MCGHVVIPTSQGARPCWTDKGTETQSSGSLPAVGRQPWPAPHHWALLLPRPSETRSVDRGPSTCFLTGGQGLPSLHGVLASFLPSQSPRQRSGVDSGLSVAALSRGRRASLLGRGRVHPGRREGSQKRTVSAVEKLRLAGCEVHRIKDP